jgi:Tat protein translocase TatB subunit
LVIAIVAIVVVGPKDLPRLMRSFGHYAGKLRRMANEFRQQVDEAMREAELEEVRKAIESVRDPSRTVDLNAAIGGNLILPKHDVVAKPYLARKQRRLMCWSELPRTGRAPSARPARALHQRIGSAPKCWRSAAL